ncbi:2-iminoacetate synthase ThiH [Desulfuromonas thiophila]|uniref:Tyrosine lyase ThiH n=1 Tax=Desulfuromonas thiophila TaxID=57664 RepID=A0A1G7BH85_9BACT|nr:2-iminoacetate synthase ThiH [Desulfuromonas thiophila]SDE25585.1 tyrosine lyase ThiH [Desulfuromonas thiophila]
MSFCDEIRRYPLEQVRDQVASRTAADVERALAAERLGLADLQALLSPAAQDYIEPLAQKAHRLTQQRFGNNIYLYTPMYLSNECSNGCKYCGFNACNKIPRATLTLEEIEREARIINDYGFRHILLLTGEAQKLADNRYLVAAIERIKPLFSSISIEVYPMDTDGYRQMVAAGVDGLTLYQETYDPQLYADLHPFGKKRDYHYRLEAPDRAGQAGLRRIGIGALLGLGDFASEAFYTGLHAQYLARRYWRSQVSISFPRIRPADGGFAPLHIISDTELVQMVCAMRLLIPDAGLFLSTRESARLRDALLPLGITHMSAGSCTAPGGHASKGANSEQFAIDDDRSPAAMSRAIRARGYEAVWKDWDSAFLNAAS